MGTLLISRQDGGSIGASFRQANHRPAAVLLGVASSEYDDLRAD
jgi:hypothetical protein